MAPMISRASGEGPTVTRLGCVSYLNALPLVEGLEKTQDVKIVRAAPAALLPMLESGEVDAALLSLLDAQKSAAPIALMPCGVIACDGRTLTVRVFSATPFERVRTVHADAESHTAAALVRVALKRLYGAQAQVVPHDAIACAARGEWPETLLMIGDKVIASAPPPGTYAYELDLGEAWKRLTGMGFTYAAWACLAERASSAPVKNALTLLDRARRQNTMRVDRIAVERSAEHGWPAPLAREYLGSLLRYDAGPPGSARRESIERFFDWCVEDGALERRSPVVWLDELPADELAAPGGAPCPA